MTIRDRGRIKWTAMMLPEHVKMLRDVWFDDFERQEKPILDEYAIQEINEKIIYAKENKVMVKISCWENGFIKEYDGIIKKVDVIGKRVELSDGENNEVISFDDVINIELL
jgi:hypothetical protein